MDRTQDAGAGFFGKVTSHGDFVARRLSQPFQHQWDAWLQSALHASRAQLGSAWLGIYLNSPIWRFALGPGVCDDNAWAGVLMPSVDRVGRHFPLTLAARMADGTRLLDWITEAGPWYDKLETLALWSLEADFSLERFDQALKDISAQPANATGLAQQMPCSSEHQNAVHCMTDLTQLSALVSQLGCAPAAQSFWWSDGSEQIAPCLLHCNGLPPAAGFAAMLDGQWTARGWQV